MYLKLKKQQIDVNIIRELLVPVGTGKKIRPGRLKFAQPERDEYISRSNLKMKVRHIIAFQILLYGDKLNSEFLFECTMLRSIRRAMQIKPTK